MHLSIAWATWTCDTDQGLCQLQAEVRPTEGIRHAGFQGGQALGMLKSECSENVQSILLHDL